MEPDQKTKEGSVSRREFVGLFWRRGRIERGVGDGGAGQRRQPMAR